MRRFDLSRRGLLLGGLVLSSGLLACAAAPGEAERKLVVIVCRGGMDGLSVTPPLGDSNYEAYRGALALGAEQRVRKLDRDFGLHPSLTALHRVYRADQMRIAPAIASQDRGRSHFQAQDVLESGDVSTGTGWLNRALLAGGGEALRGIAIGQATPLIIRGPAEAISWSPGRPILASGRLPTILQDLYRDDPMIGPAFARGLAAETMAAEAVGGVTLKTKGSATRDIGEGLAGFMTLPGGPNVATISLQGFDTHAQQGAGTGPLANRLKDLDRLVDGLREGLGGEAWNQTVVLAVTEFGRTVRTNGSAGTDHGTASTALVMGGALKKGGLIGDWPGLTEAALYENRDLRPTVDMRSLFKGALIEHMRMDAAVVEREVFPDSADARPLTGLV